MLNFLYFFLISVLKTWSIFIGGKIMIVLGFVQSWSVDDRNFSVRINSAVQICSTLFYSAFPVWLLWSCFTSCGAEYWVPRFRLQVSIVQKFAFGFGAISMFWMCWYLVWMNVIMDVLQAGGVFCICIKTWCGMWCVGCVPVTYLRRCGGTHSFPNGYNIRYVTVTRGHVNDKGPRPYVGALI